MVVEIANAIATVLVFNAIYVAMMAQL